MSRLVDKDLYSIEIKKAISKEITQREAGIKLKISDRQVRRIIASYKVSGNELLLIRFMKSMAINMAYPCKVN